MPAPAPIARTAGSPGLRRELGLGSAAAAVAGECIAVGIFLTPAGMARELGSPFWLLTVWIVMGTLTLCGALCFGELAARFPEAGGIYVYLREAFGPRVAFLYGWMSLLIMDPGITAAMAVGLGTYAAYIFDWTPVTTRIVAIACLLLLGGINILNTRLSARVLRVLTWLKFGILGVIVLWALVLRLGSWDHFRPFVQQHSGSIPLVPALAGAMVAAFFSFGGWWDVSKIGGEVRDAARNLPRAMLIGVVSVTAAYIVISAVFLYLVPLEQVTSNQGFVSQAGQVLFGNAGASILAAAVVVCVLGTLAALIMVAPRVYYAMAKDGVFLDSVARTHPRFGTPARAIAIQVTMASLLVLLGTFDQIIAYLIFSAIFFLGLTVCGLFVLRRRSVSSASVMTPLFPWTPSLFIGLIVSLELLILMRSPRQALFGCLVVLAGLPVYAALQARKRRKLEVRPSAAA